MVTLPVYVIPQLTLKALPYSLLQRVVFVAPGAQTGSPQSGRFSYDGGGPTFDGVGLDIVEEAELEVETPGSEYAGGALGVEIVGGTEMLGAVEAGGAPGLIVLEDATLLGAVYAGGSPGELVDGGGV
jgi:hypothetical protein